MGSKRKSGMRAGALVMCLCLFVCMLSGCAQTGGTSLELLESETGTEDGKGAMGRYVEEVYTLPEGIINAVSVRELENGTICVFDTMSGLYSSSDGGVTWENLYKEEFNSFAATNYCTRATILSDGSVAMIAMKEVETSESEAVEDEPAENEMVEGATTENETAENEMVEGAVTENETAEKETIEEKRMEAEEIVEDKIIINDAEDSELPEYKTYAAILTTEGKIITTENIKGMETTELNSIVGMDEKTVYVSDYQGHLYEWKTEENTCSMVASLDSYMSGISCINGKLVILTVNQLQIYNTETGEITRDESVDDFLKQYFKDDYSASTFFGGTDTLLLSAAEENAGEEDVLYLAYRNGLYRHAVGGSLMEEMIDGALSVLGDPGSVLSDIYRQKDGSFLILCQQGQLYHYTYDADVPTVPSKELKVYSLRENETVRQAINTFRKSMPDAYVSYEYGVSENSGVTTEDAIKNLSVEIMAGNGPDVLMLDDLPVESYIDKNLLLDMKPLLASSENAENLFYQNITESFGTTEGLYAVPTKFKMPMLAGKEEWVEKASDLDGLVQVMEEIRANKPEGAILEIYEPEQMLALLEMAASHTFLTEEGIVDEGAVADFLRKAAKIYELEASGITEFESAMHEAMYGSGADAELYLYGEDYNFNISNYVYKMLENEDTLLAGQVQNLLWEYTVITSAISQTGSGKYGAFSDNGEKVFIPTAIAGICANTEDAAFAATFVDTMLSKECQQVENADGLPVNKEAMDYLLACERVAGKDGTVKLQQNFTGKDVDEDNIYGTLGASFTLEDGTEQYVELSCKYPSVEEVEMFYQMIEELSTPILNDITVRETVCELGADALTGNTTVEEATEAILKKCNLYLSE